jgi:hypothetical protein
LHPIKNNYNIEVKITVNTMTNIAKLPKQPNDDFFFHDE